MTTTGAHLLPLRTRRHRRSNDDDASHLVEHALHRIRDAVDSLTVAVHLMSGQDAAFTGYTSDRPAGDGRRDHRRRLTRQEQRVLTLVAAGLPNRGIAQLLDISDKTAKNYVHSVLVKLDAGSRTEAAFTALCDRLVDPDECRRARRWMATARACASSPS